MRIKVTPERLREMARLFLQAQEEEREQGARLRSQLDGMDWDTRQKLNVEGQVEQATRLVNELAQRAEGLATSLESAAARFETADNQGAGILGASIGGAVLSWLKGNSSLPPWLQLSGAGLSAWERLSALLGAPLGGGTPLPVSGGNALVGLSFLASLPLLGGSLQSLVESVWNWLHGYGWRTNAELTTSATPVQVPQIVEVEPPPKPNIGFSAFNVPLYNQHLLEYKGNSTDWGCTAASTYMVLQYWHNRDSKAGIFSAQDILDANVKQGHFNPASGLSVTWVHDEVEGVGYSVVQDHPNSNFKALCDDVKQGPVIAIVKMGMQKSGANHAVVVTGISEDGTQVIVNDPWDGSIHIYSADEFQSSWGADFGKESKNNYTVIRP